MKTVIYGQDERVCAWVAERVSETEFISARGLGLEQDGELIAGVVYENYTGKNITMHVAAVPGKRWLNKDFLYRSFAYPFLQLNCNRVTGLVKADNFEAQKFDENLGFKKEGLLRQACEDGTDLILYGMLKTECRWIGNKNGL
jgi:RimJ/RimL family protein N-acetyltransferase